METLPVLERAGRHRIWGILLTLVGFVAFPLATIFFHVGRSGIAGRVIAGGLLIAMVVYWLSQVWKPSSLTGEFSELMLAAVILQSGAGLLLSCIWKRWPIYRVVFGSAIAGLAIAASIIGPAAVSYVRFSSEQTVQAFPHRQEPKE